MRLVGGIYDTWMDWMDISTMSKETGRSAQRSERKELPIERGFPIERINEIASRESRAKRHYRPIYTMHKWWARRLGCVFRSICLYTLLDDPEAISIQDIGENGTLNDFGGGHSEVENLIDTVDMTDPESLWNLYTKDVQVDNRKVFDPFMGGGTSVVEASRFGAKTVGNDLNPVAWFVSKKEVEAGTTSAEELDRAFEQVQSEVRDELLSYYKTSCPNDDHDAEVMHNLWVKRLDCVSCGESVPLFNDYRIGKGRYGKDGYTVWCPECDSITQSEDWRSETLCGHCGHSFIPQEGTVSGQNYTCRDCGQKYSVVDAIQEQDGFGMELYAVEYYCSKCDERDDMGRGDVKGYKPAEDRDIRLYEKAASEWNASDDLLKYIPDYEIRPGAATSTDFGSRYDGYDLPSRGYSKWSDMYNDRQLLGLSKLLKAIDGVENQNAKEYLLLAFSESLRFNTMMVGYQASANKIQDLFKTNSFDPPTCPAEANIWGAKYGMGNFRATWSMVKDGVAYAKAPTERYIVDGSAEETESFNTPIGQNASVSQGDSMQLDYENEFDAVITDPPYYDNIMYSELSDYFYVWQKQVLDDQYECYESTHTPRAESIVANPAENKGETEFEKDLFRSFETILKSLKDDGALVFTYHHSSSESWGELLEALCEIGFEVTATYPISSDIQKFTKGEVVEFDIVIVARPAGQRSTISWNSLRRNIYRTAQRTHQQLEEHRDLSQGDIGVIEMGECFHEYSKHHGKVKRAGEEMSAKEVVDEIYGIIQQGSDIGEIDVFLDLLETPDATYNDLNKLTRGTDANPDQMEDMQLYRMEGGKFILGTWGDEKRMAYIQERVNGDDQSLNALDKAQFLRYRYEQGKSTQNYLSKWDINDELRELCEGLADATGDNTYRRILGADSTLGDF